MFVIHLVVVKLLLRSSLKKHYPKLVGAVGTISTVFYISVITAMTAPLHCQNHPNGKWTVVEYDTVLCWTSSTHMQMLVAGGVALSLPLAYLAAVCYVVWIFKGKLRSGDQ
eukprot:5885227-Amphidinium_carterae.1